RARKEGPTKVLSTTHRFSEVFGIDSVTKSKVKGHVKEKALERIRTVAKATLESFEGEMPNAQTETEAKVSQTEQVGDDQKVEEDDEGTVPEQDEEKT
ncbi:MAG: hypothetical protein MUC62_10330, partial [Candidatus Thermoplasmatota archaeon]|nr:hypothetical protein [Candidatus Thermoplasmatota archaeon]